MEKQISKFGKKLIDDGVNDVWWAIAELDSLLPLIVNPRPSRPMLKMNANSEDALEFAEKLKTYEKNVEDFKAVKKQNDEIESKRNLAMKEFILHLSGCNAVVPERYIENVYAKAYSDGHSDGWHEIYICLCGLVEIFE